MTTEQSLTLVNIGLTTIVVLITFYNYRHSREKDFHDHLYKMKVETYRRMMAMCVEAKNQLNINSSPFHEVYDIKNEADWKVHFEKEIGKLYSIGFGMQGEIFRETIFLPSHVMDKFFEFSEECLHFVTIASHFNTEYIVDKQDKLHDLFFELVNVVREDLGSAVVDETLQRRMREIGTP